MREKLNKRRLGSDKESLAVEYLEKQGYVILERNFMCKKGEIDVIAREDGFLVFVEVKFRTDESAGEPGEAIDVRKQKTIYKVAEYYIYSKHLCEDIPCRFDAVTIVDDRISLVKNAFGGLSM